MPFNPGADPPGVLGVSDDGTSSGRKPRIMHIPPIPTIVESEKPVFVRSIKYHRTGFAMARVTDAWVVDCQGILL